MNRGEGILPAGLVARGAEVQGTEVQRAAVWGALVRCMSCHTAQAIICLKAAVHHCVCSGSSIVSGGIFWGVFLLQRKIIWETGVPLVGDIEW